MTMNAFEKQHFHYEAPAWIHSSLPEGADSRTTLHMMEATGHEGASTLLADLSPNVRAGTTMPPLGGLMKRVLDLIVGTVALLMAAPVMIVVALLIRMTMGGPAIFSHRRVGFGGKPFNCYKFRSMVANSEEVLRTYLAANPEAAREWAETHKIRDDPRVTFFGRMLRKSSLDELPQLFNVIRGDMSCVGPRPIVVDELRRYGDFVGEYLRARPGLTGLWQVSGRSNTGYADRVMLDSQYVRNWSLWLDMGILCRTVVAVIRFDRAA